MRTILGMLSQIFFLNIDRWKSVQIEIQAVGAENYNLSHKLHLLLCKHLLRKIKSTAP